jgi:hypothetical protein
MSPQVEGWGGGVWGLSCAHGTKINFGDLLLYLTCTVHMYCTSVLPLFHLPIFANYAFAVAAAQCTGPLRYFLYKKSILVILPT